MNNYYSPYGNENNQNYYQQNLYYQMKAKQERREIRKVGNMMGCCVLGFLAVQIASSYLLLFNDGLYDLYNSSSVFQNSFGIIFVELLAVVLPFGIMAFVNRKKYASSLIPSKHIKFSELCLWVGFGMLCCVGADYIVAILMTISETLGFELTQSETAEPNSVFACVISVISTAVVPALCEEFAMRCCSLGLLKKYGKSLGVIGVSIVFGLLHGNLIQFVFATLVGLILGFVTIKTDSIIPAILIHGFNNGMSAVSTVLEYAFGTDAGTNANFVLFVFWIVAGIVSVIVLTVKKKLSFRLDPPAAPEPFANSTAQKVGAFISSPVLIVSSLYLIISVISSIQKI